MEIRIGDNSDPTLNALCTTATDSGAYRCDHKGRYVAFVGSEPLNLWKIYELMAFDTYIP